MAKNIQNNLPVFLTNCLSVFDHFVALALKGLKNNSLVFNIFQLPITEPNWSMYFETHT